MRTLRLLLLPLAWLYGGVAALRRYLYRRGWLKSYTPSVPTICIGNLRVGGTGKTPHTEYIARLLSQSQKLAILSRGYRRKTTGFVLAQQDATAATIGDEPLQYFRKFPSVTVAVDEKRAEGIQKLQQQCPDLEVVLLDDAYQHLQVKAACNILITPFNDLYVNDFPLPAGNLREFRCAARDADVIVVSKTPLSCDEKQREVVLQALSPKAHQRVFFTAYEYQPLRPVTPLAEQVQLEPGAVVLALTGVAQPEPLYKELELRGLQVVPVRFPDHHTFSDADMARVVEQFQQKHACSVITTEKDYMRLRSAELENVLSLLPVFVAPISVKILFNQENQFNKTILSYVTED
ncbi:MAG: tetraacyldisaccharide 4'-kinase [Bacteroidales bacterium]|nr:tetraacyldisaccharide 4'-kinase [Bacteroidales bacterium]